MIYNSFELKEISWGERKLSDAKLYKMKTFNGWGRLEWRII